MQSPGLEVFRHDLIGRVTALRGVVEAGLTSAVPFRGVDFTYVLSAVGQRKTVVGNARFVDPGYFTVMRIPLMHGRLVSDTDTVVSRKVVVLSESYARLMFGSDNPLGKQIDPDDPAEVSASSATCAMWHATETRSRRSTFRPRRGLPASYASSRALHRTPATSRPPSATLFTISIRLCRR